MALPVDLGREWWLLPVYGDLFGAMAFLLECERVTDIWAATDFRILSLSESTIRASIESDAHGAAHLMLNIAKMLCVRLLKSRG